MELNILTAMGEKSAGSASIEKEPMLTCGHSTPAELPKMNRFTYDRPACWGIFEDDDDDDSRERTTQRTEMSGTSISQCRELVLLLRWTQDGTCPSQLGRRKSNPCAQSFHDHEGAAFLMPGLPSQRKPAYLSTQQSLWSGPCPGIRVHRYCPRPPIS